MSINVLRNLVLWHYHSGTLPGANVPNLEINTAQSVHKLNSFREKFYFSVFWWSSHFTKYTRNFLVVKLMVLVDS